MEFHILWASEIRTRDSGGGAAGARGPAGAGGGGAGSASRAAAARRVPSGDGDRTTHYTEGTVYTLGYPAAQAGSSSDKLEIYRV